MERIMIFFKSIHFDTRSFRARLMLTFTMTSVLPLLAALIIAAIQMGRSFEEQMTDSLIAFANMEQQRIESQLKNAVDTSSILINYVNGFQARDGIVKEKSYISLLNFEQIRRQVRNLQGNNHIQKIRIYSDLIPFVNGDGINFFPMERLNETGLPPEAYAERVPINRLRSIISLNKQSPLTSIRESSVSFYRVIRNLDGEVTAVFFIDYPSAVFLYQEEGMLPYANYAITDKANQFIYQSPEHPGEIPTDNGFIDATGYFVESGHLYVQRRFAESDWTLTLDTPLANIHQSTIALVPIYIFIILITILACCVFGYYLSNRVTKKLYRFFDAVNCIDDSNFTSNALISKRLDELTKNNSTGDEIDNVMYLVSDLVRRNSTLKDEAANHELSIEKYKLAILQEQINPHFLYNALDTIRASILLGKKDVAHHLVSELSLFYRICLSGGKDIIPIKQELSMVEHYLEIECAGYDQRISWEIHCQSELAECIIPKLTLQPLIENSIIHGMEPGTTNNLHINISVRSFQDNILILVEDNGKGIEPDKAAALNKIQQIHSLEDSGSFGIQNIRNRIQLMFGDSYGVEIIPKPRGTANRIVIPMEF